MKESSKPLETLRLLYASGAYGHADTLESDLEAHRRSGFVLSGDDFIIVFRLCGLDWSWERLHDPGDSDPDGALCWVWAIAGNAEAAFLAAIEHGPAHQVTHVGYDRRGKARLVPLSRFFGNFHSQKQGQDENSTFRSSETC